LTDADLLERDEQIGLEKFIDAGRNTRVSRGIVYGCVFGDGCETGRFRKRGKRVEIRERGEERMG
jgi:hypothetical protein